MARRVGVSVFTPAVAGEVLARIADGGTLHGVCGKDRRAGLPERMTVYNWMRARPGFAQAYRLAVMARGELTQGPIQIGGRRRRTPAGRWAAVVVALGGEG